MARALGGRVISEHTLMMPQKWTVIINWGSSECRFRKDECKLFNTAEAVRLAANKLLSFQRLSERGVSVPTFASKKEDVSWEGITVVRHKLTGHSGEGIEIIENEELPDARLYVEYVPKIHEYRIHVVGDEVTTIQRKAKRNDVAKEDANWKVRNLAGGFIFARADVNPPASVLSEAVAAIKALGLDFGAVDIVWNDKRQKAYVLEVNTAPGMEGTTIDEYARAFKKLIG